MDYTTAAFVQHALAQGTKAVELVQAPESFAQQFGGSLSQGQLDAIRDLGALDARQRVASLSTEARGFVKAVVTDGRYLLDWREQPDVVAGRLGLSVHPDVIDEIRDVDIDDLFDHHPDELRGLGLVAFAIAVIVAAADVVDEDLTIRDLSRVEKL